MTVMPVLTADQVEPVARALIPELRTREIQTDGERKVPAENIKLLAESGLLGIFRAKKWGGSELNMQAHMDAVSTIAEGCQATAWCLGVYHAHDFLIAHMPEEAQREIYETNAPQAVAAVIGPRGKAVKQDDGSYVLNGFWPFASGNAASDWLLLGAEAVDKDGNMLDLIDLAVLKKDLVEIDDWKVAGLQGTGSNSVKAVDVKVPGHRTVSLAAVIEGQTKAYLDPNTPPVHRLMGTPALAMFIATSTIGAAKHALEEFRRVVPGKMIQYTDNISHEWSVLQIALAEAETKIRMAEMLFRKCCEDIDDYAERNEKMPMEMRGRYRMDVGMVPRLCRDAVNQIYTLGGAAGLSLKSPIQLNARNLQAANMHGLLLYEAGAEVYGRVLFGVEPGTPII